MLNINELNINHGQELLFATEGTQVTRAVELAFLILTNEK